MTKTKENKIRRALAKQGFYLHKSRTAESIDNFGGYMICDGYSGHVVAGERFQLNLDDVEEFLAEDGD